MVGVMYDMDVSIRDACLVVHMPRTICIETGHASRIDTSISYMTPTIHVHYETCISYRCTHIVQHVSIHVVRDMCTTRHVSYRAYEQTHVICLLSSLSDIHVIFSNTHVIFYEYLYMSL